MGGGVSRDRVTRCMLVDRDEWVWWEGGGFCSYEVVWMLRHVLVSVG